MITGGAHLQPLCAFHFFIGGVNELLVGGDRLLQMLLLTAAELLVFLSLEVLLAAQRPGRHLEAGTDRQADGHQMVEPQLTQTGQEVDLLDGGEQLCMTP